MTDPLFDLEIARDGLPEIPAGLSSTRRRTLRRLIMLEMGRHPVTALPVHPDAPADASSKDRYPREFTCGTCVHRFVMEYRDYRYPKCDVLSASEQKLRTARTDTPRWMPACVAYRSSE